MSASIIEDLLQLSLDQMDLTDKKHGVGGVCGGVGGGTLVFLCGRMWAHDPPNCSKLIQRAASSLCASSTPFCLLLFLRTEDTNCSIVGNWFLSLNFESTYFFQGRASNEDWFDRSANPGID